MVEPEQERIVIDTSALVAVVTGEATRPWLIERTRAAELLAPASVPWEIGNAFSAMLRRRRADLRELRVALLAFRAIPLRLVEVDLGLALTLCAEHGLYAYDAYLLACAQVQRCRLLTLDGGLAHVARRAGVRIVEVEP
jgi:predicted nucleic acid-binding protein